MDLNLRLIGMFIPLAKGHFVLDHDLKIQMIKTSNVSLRISARKLCCIRYKAYERSLKTHYSIPNTQSKRRKEKRKGKRGVGGGFGKYISSDLGTQSSSLNLFNFED